MPESGVDEEQLKQENLLIFEKIRKLTKYAGLNRAMNWQGVSFESPLTERPQFWQDVSLMVYPEQSGGIRFGPAGELLN